MILNALFGLVFMLLTTSCEPINRYMGLEDDNWIENSVEDAIQYETGAQIDLSPSDPNNGFHLYPRKK